MPSQIILLLIGLGVFALLVFGVMVLLSKFYRMVDQGTALIVNRRTATALGMPQSLLSRADQVIE